MRTKCSVEGCERALSPSNKSGFCEYHYRKNYEKKIWAERKKDYHREYYKNHKKDYTAITCSFKTRELMKIIEEEEQMITYDEVLMFLIDLYDYMKEEERKKDGKRNKISSKKKDKS